MCKIQADKSPSIEPIIMIFTPTPWLIPRPTFSHFRSIFDQYFKFEKGFMVNGKEFFKGIGRWPVSFTIWRFNQKKNKNRVVLLNLTELKSSALSTIPWNQNLDIINQEVKKILKGKKYALRSMKAPGTAFKNHPELGDDPQPAVMSNYIKMTGDDGGVHYNSGIPNFAFYVAAYEMAGNAWEKAGAIWYAALTDKKALKKSATFKDARKATIAKAKTLYGAGSNEVKAVTKGWDAAEVK